MLKFIGAVVLIGVVIVGIGVCTNNAKVDAHVKLTPQAQQQIQKVRNKAADEIRGR